MTFILEKYSIFTADTTVLLSLLLLPLLRRYPRSRYQRRYFTYILYIHINSFRMKKSKFKTNSIRSTLTGVNLAIDLGYRILSLRLSATSRQTQQCNPSIPIPTSCHRLP